MINNDILGLNLLIAILAMAVSMAIIPIMMRLAPAVGMIDTPDSRKVHSIPIPRVGGLGIVIGSLAPMLIWLPFTDLTVSIILVILLKFIAIPSIILFYVFLSVINNKIRKT